MPTFRTDLHTGHDVPLIETDDLSDGAITSDKIADNAVVWDKIGNDVKDRINAMSSVNISVSPEVIMKGIQSNVHVEAFCCYEADEIRIKQNGIYVATGSGQSLVFLDVITPTGTDNIVYTAEFINGDDIKVVNKTLYVAQPIYYGAGQSYEDATNVASPRITPVGDYRITVENDGSRIFFVLPASMSIAQVTMNGFDVDFDNPTVILINDLAYKVYQSSDVYNQFNEIIKVS